MNEPTNPPESNASDSPPPPPPPFTPPPAPSAETPPPPPPPPAPPSPPTIPPAAPAPPPVAPPRPPIYTPPPGEPPKKSATPWVLGGCGCLTLIILAIVLAVVMINRAKRQAIDFKRDFKSALESIDEKRTSPSVSPRSLSSPSSSYESTTQRSGPANSYVNVKEKLPSSLQPNFVAFSFSYSKNFEMQPQSETNFVKVEKYAAAGKGSTAENFAVGSAWFDPPSAQSVALYDKLLDQLGQQISGSFHNYKELRRTAVTVDGIESRASLFQADFNNAAKTMIYGKIIVVHPPGKKNGVTILMLGTSLGRDVKSPEDLGTKGETADILRSFKFL